MNARIVTVLCAVMFLLLSSGCTSTQAPAAVPTPAAPEVLVMTPEPVPTETTVPAPSVTDTPAPVETKEVSPAATITPTWIPTAYGRDELDYPKIVSQTFVTNVFGYEIPDCGMRAEFPAFADDPAYGLSRKPAKLGMITEEEMLAFMRANAGDHRDDPDPAHYVDANLVGGTACNGAIANPKWGFVRFNTTLIPRNVRPGEYEIGLNIFSKGNVVAQLRLNETFEMEKPVIIVRYIPVHTNDMDAFDSIGLVFARKTS